MPRRNIFLAILSMAVVWGQVAGPVGTPVGTIEARAFYLRTEYHQSLTLLNRSTGWDSATFQLIGQNHFMLGEYKRAAEAFERALSLNPQSSEIYHWLGRTSGKRAETGSIFTSPGNAVRARTYFEKAVQLDPSNAEALNDLFNFYLEAPGFLGGGIERAEALVPHIGRLDPAEAHYAQAQLSAKRKQFDQEEQHLRRAAELAPDDPGRWIDVAKCLARHGRLEDADAVFDHAAGIAPGKPQVLFARAQAYIDHGHRIEEARMLLDRYLRSPLTPEDPPREQAAALLRKIGR